MSVTKFCSVKKSSGAACAFLLIWECLTEGNFTPPIQNSVESLAFWVSPKVLYTYDNDHLLVDCGG